jgi:hypothetical protein
VGDFITAAIQLNPIKSNDETAKSSNQANQAIKQIKQ